jgi:GT2 family glycosyltransferase
MINNQIDASIIIVNYKTHDLVLDCIHSIIDKTIGIIFEIIVVDNDSNDRSGELIKSKFPEVIFIQSGSNLGFGKANNLGIEISRGRNILFLNSDTLLVNNAVKILSSYLDSNEDVGVCGGNLYDLNHNHIHSFTRRFPGIYMELDAIFNFKISKLLKKETTSFNLSLTPIKVSYICGADMMVRKDILDKVGFFDPDFFLYFEETELSYRITKAGYNLHNVPFAKIIHLEGASQSTSLSKLKFYNKSRKIYYKKIYNSSFYFLVCGLFYLKCLLGLVKSLIFFRKSNIKLWYNNILTF